MIGDKLHRDPRNRVIVSINNGRSYTVCCRTICFLIIGDDNQAGIRNGCRGFIRHKFQCTYRIIAVNAEGIVIRTGFGIGDTDTQLTTAVCQTTDRLGLITGGSRHFDGDRCTG